MISEINRRGPQLSQFGQVSCQVGAIEQDLNRTLYHIVDAGIQTQHPDTSGL